MRYFVQIGGLLITAIIMVMLANENYLNMDPVGVGILSVALLFFFVIFVPNKVIKMIESFTTESESQRRESVGSAESHSRAVEEAINKAVNEAVKVAVREAVAAERKRHDKEIADIFDSARLTNTITGTPITSLNDFNAWKVQFEYARMNKTQGKRYEEKINFTGTPRPKSIQLPLGVAVFVGFFLVLMVAAFFYYVGSNYVPSSAAPRYSASVTQSPVIQDEGFYTIETPMPYSPPPSFSPVETYITPLLPVLIENGEVVLSPTFKGDCPLSVTVSGSNAFYVRLSYDGIPTYSYDTRTPYMSISERQNDIAFYIAPNSSVELDVPIGKYKLYYCEGKTWYGTPDYFGPDTIWQTADEVFEFYTSYDIAHGHTLELYPQVGGNFETYVIDESDLPF